MISGSMNIMPGMPLQLSMASMLSVSLCRYQYLAPPAVKLPSTSMPCFPKATGSKSCTVLAIM